MPEFQLADRLKRLPPYLFAEIDKKKKAAMAAGRDIINLGIGDPDTPTPEVIVRALADAASDPGTHQYALDAGEPSFRETIAEWFERRYGVALDPETEIYPTIGSKEAIAHFPLAYVNPGDVVLVPEPGYPPYRSGTLFAGGEPHAMPLLEDNGYMPDLDSIPADVRKKAKVMWLNYPNSPTGALATKAFFEKAIAFCRENGIILAQDAAYGEMVYEGRAFSIMEVEGAREMAIEFHSFSKTFNMTGWRVGWAVGAPALIKALGKVKSNIDSGVFTAVQRAAQVAIRNYDKISAEMTELYRRRRDVFCNGLLDAGWKLDIPPSTFYVWFRVRDGWTSEATVGRLLDEVGIVTTPGNGFGATAEGYVRVALTVDETRLREAVERIAKLTW